MTSFIDRLLGRNSASGSAKVAKERLQFVLVHDRLDLSPEKLSAMENEILEVISKYVNIDRQNVEIVVEQRKRNSWLVADIPLAPEEGKQ
ncbi:MAG: cell division topological specificity factor MinE [Anaerolineae bacterium]